MADKKARRRCPTRLPRLPLELVSKILVFRPRHPAAAALKHMMDVFVDAVLKRVEHSEYHDYEDWDTDDVINQEFEDLITDGEAYGTEYEVIYAIQQSSKEFMDELKSQVYARF